ncbi:beta-lactamase regulating signal transducer with metallopeptidase domain [Inhella inkyongensis]|uniref:Beta-lactamase regulating signal transducer with metallopeptidase domain n=1 Tax=Inhella inkyongensis TaxID=392593 RepID=A0A840S8R7_9BURK|nr:M56 family metallopeptidase [Inhella inkyongensis]MBB5206012.1 beta-lactamase regulating signal transducer with metallopeptidase domain [Inhella inkyongensis]
MSDTLTLLTLASSATVLALALMRPLLLRLGGPAALYGAWGSLPLVLAVVALAPLLPDMPQAPAEPLLVLRVDELSAAPRAWLTATPAAGMPWLPLWATGVAAFALLLLTRHARFARQLRQRRLPAGHSPAWVGLWRARLWLPADFRHRFEPAERRLILAHERVHAQRADNLWNLLATLWWLSQWFNPLAWWALHRLRGDQELAADAQVLRRHPDQTGRYLRALAKAQPGLDALPFSAFAPHPLIERIRMLKSQQARVARPWIALLSALLLGGAAWAMSPQRGAPAEPAKTQSAAAPQFVLETWAGDRRLDQQVLSIDPKTGASVRLKAFDDSQPLLVTLKAQAQAKDSHRVQAHLNLGFPTNTSSEGEGIVQLGQPLQLAIDNPNERSRKLVLAIHRAAPAPILDPDQRGSVALSLVAFVDDKQAAQAEIKLQLGEAQTLTLGGPQFDLLGQLKAQAYSGDGVGLAFEGSINGRSMKPRLIAKNGQRATLEFNSPEDPRLVRIELTPRRITP